MRKAAWILLASAVLVPVLVAACSRTENPPQNATPAAAQGAQAPAGTTPAAEPAATPAAQPATPAGQPAAPATPAGGARPAPAAPAPVAKAPAAKAPAAAPEPAAPPKPVVEWREVTVPAGTEIPVELETAVGSDTSNVEDPVRARVTQAVSVEGVAAIPAGSSVTGSVITAKKASKFKGHAELSLRFDSLIPAGSDERHNIRTTLVAHETAGTGKKSAMKIGLPALGGAVIGGIIGGGKGAAIGAAAGGGAGTVVVLTSDGKEVSLPQGTPLGVKLVDPLTLRVRVSPQ
jgi:hypothetical protein